MATPSIDLESDPSGPVVVVLAGEHDLSSAEAVREALAASAPEAGLVIDLDRTEFVDSSILGVIVQGYRDAAETGRGFAVVLGEQTPAPVRRIVSLTSLDSVLPTFPDRTSALEAVRIPAAPVPDD